MKVKVVIKEETRGTRYAVYEKWLWFWIWVDGFPPLTTAKFIIDQDINRLRALYGENLIVEDHRK